jgi:hypothetical protein
MQKFTTKIVDMMKSEGLFEWQGGPIILSQVCLQLYILAACLFGWWLVLICSERKVLLDGCWWLVGG